MEKVNMEVATSDVEKWLGARKIKNKKREESADAIESLIESVCEGNIIVEDDFTLTHNLDFPLTNSEGIETVESLQYKPRLNAFEIEKAMKGVKIGSIDGRLQGFISALSLQPKAVIGRLESADLTVAQNVAVFFM